AKRPNIRMADGPVRSPLTANEIAGETHRNTHRVLVVDDDFAFRSTLAETVNAWGYQTDEAASVAEAVAVVERYQPAAVLLDLRLPDGSGMNVLEHLRKLSPHSVVIIITGHFSAKDAFDAGTRRAYGFLTKPVDHEQLQSMLDAALAKPRVARAKRAPANRTSKRGRPRQQTTAPLGQLVLSAMKFLGLTYKDIVVESERLALIHNNSDMRIGKSTLGNIISGSIRQPGTAKLDSLRNILNLSRSEIDAAIGLHPQRRLTEQLSTPRARTREVSVDAVTRHRRIKIPILRDETKLQNSQFLEGALKEWAGVEVEYLSAFYPPYLGYVVIGEQDTNASPIAPPGSRVLVNKLLNKVRPAENVSFHERELFYVLTPHGPTCVYLEYVSNDKIVLIPHPLSGNLREEFVRDEVTIVGQVIGVLYPE
ncbi:MAG TPA: response regulator, partial [Pyrinomonadaceae bacterium]|nr:response regulator [Pyrinomonadaceae bacterium]